MRCRATHRQISTISSAQSVNQYAISYSGLNSIFRPVQKCTALQCSCYIHDLRFVKVLMNEWAIMAEQTIAARMWSSCVFQDVILGVATVRNDPICDIPINIRPELVSVPSGKDPMMTLKVSVSACRHTLRRAGTSHGTLPVYMSRWSGCQVNFRAPCHDIPRESPQKTL